MMLWIERGGPVMWPILLLSVVALTLILERVLFWARERKRSVRDVLNRFLVQHPDVLDMTDERDLDVSVRAEERRLERGMAVLDTIITSAPLLGILGTVLGIIKSFELLSTSNNADPLAVSGGVAQALITTASGLVVALVVIFPYNGFRSLVRDRLDEFEHELRRIRTAVGKE